MILRFPPSPTGRLHIGNVRTALYNWLLARKGGGRFILRIEDTDAARSSRASEEAILADLRWLGLDWDEGPDRGGPHGPYRQSERGPVYAEHLRALVEAGAAYRCFCSAAELEAERERALAEKRPPRYSGKCRSVARAEAARRVADGQPASIRFRVEDGDEVAWRDLVHGPTSFEREVIGDFVIARSDGTPAYNFAVVVDDALMGVSLVMRGDDHISNTPRQILLYRALGFQPPDFAHLPMILGPDGARLSKRHGATSVEQFRGEGFLPEALINYLALLGWNPGDERELFTLGELSGEFSLQRVSRSAAVFSTDKLLWLNGQYMRSLPPERVLTAALPFLLQRGLLAGEPTGELRSWAERLVTLFAPSAATLDELAAGAQELIYGFGPAAAVADPQCGQIISTAEARQVLRAFLEESKGADLAQTEVFKEVTKAVRKGTGAKGKELFHPLRVGVTGRAAGPELDRFVSLLEKAGRLELPRRVSGARERIAQILEELGS